MEFYTLLFIAVGLSMDAFSLSLAYGTVNINKKDGLLLSFIVGIYHLIMPLLGIITGKSILSKILLNPDLIIFIILLFIGVNLIKDSFEKKEEFHKMPILELLTFGLAVSMDSFSIGIGLNTITNNYFLSASIFSICSFLFTILGLFLGKKVNQLLGRFATFLGGIILICIGISIFLTK